MKALVLRGKYKGKEVEIGQWCNDWFSTNTGNWSIDRDPFPPTRLAFDMEGMKEIKKHKNNGMLFEWYREELGDKLPEPYLWIFKRIQKRLPL